MREDVKKAIEKYQIKTFGNRKTIEKAESALYENETVLYATPTNILITSITDAESTVQKFPFPGVVFLTDQRALFYRSMKNKPVVNEIQLSKILTIQFQSNSWNPSCIRLIDETNFYDFTISYRQDAVQKLMELFESAIENYNLEHS